MTRGLQILVAIVLAAGALLSGCASHVADGAIVLDSSDEDSMLLRVVDVDRSPLAHNEVQFDLLTGEAVNEEDALASGQTGDHIIVVFEIENPEGAYGERSFNPRGVVVGWHDKYNEGTGGPVRVEVQPGTTEQFEETYTLSHSGQSGSVTGPEDLTFYVKGVDAGLWRTQGGLIGPYEIDGATEVADFSVPMTELWDGEF